MNGTVFSLDNRLALCASFVREGTRLVDVGTDHAYLPVWLAINGKISCAVACDVRVGPLRNARNNIRNYHVENVVSAVLSDGLDNINPKDALDVVIAGMGGELIAKIIQKQQWLCDNKRRLILQPMTRAESLRLFLCKNGFKIFEEKACVSGKKSYSVMVCSYDGIRRECSDKFKYAGLLSDDDSPDAKRYIFTVNNKLKKKIKSYDIDSQEYKDIYSLILDFDKITEEYVSNGNGGVKIW